jgi:hypothetical protein
VYAVTFPVNGQLCMKKVFPSILDRNFKYVPSGKTNIRKTFDRIRKEQKEATTVQTTTETQPINIFVTRKIAKG